MLLLSCSAKLRLLEGMLRRSLPETLPVHDAVMNIIHGNPAGHEVLVDSWPEFKTVLTRPRRQVATDDSDFYTNTYTAYYRDLGACRALLSSAVNWGQAFRIHGLQYRLHMAFREIARVAGGQLEVSNLFTYLHPDPSTMPEIRCQQMAAERTMELLSLWCFQSALGSLFLLFTDRWQWRAPFPLEHQATGLTVQPQMGFPVAHTGKKTHFEVGYSPRKFMPAEIKFVSL